MKREEKLKHAGQTFQRMVLERGLAHGPDPAHYAAVYRIAGYADGLVGATPECDVLRPHYDSGLKWPDPENPKPDDVCWDAGVAGGVRWDGTLYRDLARYPAGGALFWSAYLKPGSAPGMKQGYWLNFGSGWCHLHNDDPAQMLSGATPRLFGETATEDGGPGTEGGILSPVSGLRSSVTWKLVIEATKFVTYETVLVWSGVKVGGNDPVGIYARVDGLDTTAALTIEAGV